MSKPITMFLDPPFLPFPPSSSPSNKPVNNEKINVKEFVMGTASDISIGG